MTYFFAVKFACLIASNDPSIPTIEGYYEGNIRFMKKEWTVAVDFEQRKSYATVAYIDFPEIGAYHKMFQTRQANGKIHFERQQPDGRLPLVFNGVISKDSVYGQFDGIGIQGAEFVLRPATKFDLEEEIVVFYNDTIKLSGTLMKPKREGIIPVVVFTHGSNPDTRDVYYGAAIQFVKKGIAALIYDKRGVGESVGGDHETAGITGLAEDAISGIRMLKERGDIDSKHMGIFGHSQGGWIAPMAAVLSRDVAFVITSAASAVSAADQSVYHRMNVMRQEGYNETEVLRAAAIRRRMNDATKLCATDQNAAIEALKRSSSEIRTVRQEKWFGSAALPESLHIGCPEKLMMELLFTNPSEIWNKVKIPTYLVWGERDIVVPVDKHTTIVETLKESGNHSVTVKLIPNVNHSITIVNSSGEWDFPREPPNYFGDMADWVNSLSSGK